MKLSASILALALLLAVGLSCNLAERFAGGDESVMVTELWSDVPPFPEATKTDMKLPLPMRILFTRMMKGKVAFISFRTDKTPQEVKQFYSGNNMTDAGWTRADESCFRDSKDVQTGGAMCTFTKSRPKQEMVAIMVQPEAAGALIFYTRVDVSQQRQ